MSDIKGIYSNSLTALSLNSEAQVRINQQRALFVRMTDDTGAYVAPGGGTTDEAAWTAGASSFSPGGGAFNDSAAALTSGQQGTVRSTANRAMHVNLRDHLGNEATLTGNSLNVNVTNAASGGTAAVDEAAATAGTSQFTPIGGVFNDSFTSLTSGQMGMARLTATRALHVQIDNASVAVTGTFWQATQPVSGTVTANIGTTNGLALDTSVTGLQVAQGSTTSGQKGGLVLGAVTTSPPAYTTAQSSPLSLDTAGSLRVSVMNASLAVTGTFWQATQPVSGTVTANQGTANTHANAWFARLTDGTTDTVVKAASTAAVAADPALVVAISPNNTIAATQSGTWNIGTVTTVTTVSTVTTCGNATASNFNAQVVGSVASASADSGNPVKIGGVAINAIPTAAANGNRMNLSMDLEGRALVALADRSQIVRSATLTLTTTTETTILAAGAAGVFRDLTMLVITNTSATAVRVDIRDATAGTIQFAIAIAANGGAVIPFSQVPLNQTTAANNWTAQLSAAVTDIRILAVAVERKA